MAETPQNDSRGAGGSRTPLLLTKLQPPPVPADVVPRRALLERLDEGLQRRLILLVAPAGYGKTTLLGQWLQQSELPIAWVALDSGDDEPTRFWRYVIAALDSALPGVGQPALELLLQTPQPPLESVLTTLLNDLSAAPRRIVLVLDDYHQIRDAAIHEGLAFLLEHLPTQLLPVLASRATPPLPLPRLRARGQLVEVRAGELRLTLEESTAFLHSHLGVQLAPDEMKTLHARAEGWVAALQLAALALEGHEAGRVVGILEEWSGSHPHVQGYLEQEVLQQQPPEVQEFLLQTSILTRLEAPLCDAVTGREGSTAILEQLEQAGLFLIPLDEERRRYRYHPLLADFLRARLRQAQPDLAAELHRRASAWFEQRDLLAEAFGHALAAADWERAGRLLQPLVLSKVQSGELPPEALDPTRPFGARQIDAILRALGVRTAARQDAKSGRPATPDRLLTEREQEVLRLLANKRSYHAIAGELTITKNTVKWHVKSAYRKLGVSRRSEAIEKARELKLLA